MGLAYAKAIGGTRAELENYMRTIEIFDVDWLKGMSVGVFPLKSGKASKVVSDLEKVFGETSKSPVAGMMRFLPLDGANAVLVITSQPRYLDEIQSWLDRIEGAGGEIQLFSYELKYVKAKDLADRLSEVFGGSLCSFSDPPAGARPRRRSSQQCADWMNSSASRIAPRRRALPFVSLYRPVVLSFR